MAGTARKRLPRDERKEAILLSSLRAFARKNYMRVTTRELADEAGLSEPALYKYFDGKRDLFITLIDYIGRRMVERWKEIAAQSPDSLTALHDIGVHHFRRVIRDRDYTRVMFQAISEVSDPEILAAVERVYSSFVDFITKLLRKAARQNHLRNSPDVKMVAWHFLSLGFTLNLIGLLGLDRDFVEKNLEGWGLPLFEYVRGDGHANGVVSPSGSKQTKRARPPRAVGSRSKYASGKEMS